MRREPKSTFSEGAAPVAPAPPKLDSHGRFRAHGRLSYGVLAMYGFLLLIVALFLPRSDLIAYWWTPWVFEALVLTMLVRYASTTYRIDDVQLRAIRILGGRRIPLSDVRRIEYASLHELAPSGTFFGGWGWRGRMWSPQIGPFDAVHTDASHGLLVTGGPVPLYLSPRDPTGFARELSRRVRSHIGRISYDVGDPLGTGSAESG